MRLGLVSSALLLSVAVLTVSGPAQARSAKDFVYGQGRASQYCRPPLKFAAGACVRRCPAGYRDTGRFCRFRNMNR